MLSTTFSGIFLQESQKQFHFGLNKEVYPMDVLQACNRKKIPTSKFATRHVAVMAGTDGLLQRITHLTGHPTFHLSKVNKNKHINLINLS